MQRFLPPLAALLALAGLPSLASPGAAPAPALPEAAGTVLWQLDTGG